MKFADLNLDNPAAEAPPEEPTLNPYRRCEACRWVQPRFMDVEHCTHPKNQRWMQSAGFHDIPALLARTEELCGPEGLFWAPKRRPFLWLLLLIGLLAAFLAPFAFFGSW